MQAKLTNTFTPKFRDQRINLEGPGHTRGKSLALADYVKAHRGTIILIESVAGSQLRL